MQWSETLREIESEGFAVRLNVASTRKVFLAALTAERAFLRLVRLMRETPASASRVLKRVRALANVQFDLAYEHPYDSALAAYSWALALQQTPFARVAAELLLNTPQTCWARQVARLVLEQLPASTADGQTESVAVADGAFERNKPHAYASSPGVSRSVVFSSFLSGPLDFDFVTAAPDTSAGAAHAYIWDFLWAYQAPIWDGSRQALRYANRPRDAAEAPVERVAYA